MDKIEEIEKAIRLLTEAAALLKGKGGKFEYIAQKLEYECNSRVPTALAVLKRAKVLKGAKKAAEKRRKRVPDGEPGIVFDDDAGDEFPEF